MSYGSIVCVCVGWVVQGINNSGWGTVRQRFLEEVMPDLKNDKELARQKARRLQLKAKPKSASEKVQVLWVPACSLVLLEHKI